jgi:hypothetical protein
MTWIIIGVASRVASFSTTPHDAQQTMQIVINNQVGIT